MLRRVWSCTIDPGRAEAYEEFARLTSLPMFRAQPGFQGCVMARKGTSCDVITLWSDQAAVDALERSESYQATVAAIRASGFVTAEIGTNVATVHLLSLTSTALAAPASEPGADL